MELTLKERIVLLSILPKSGNFLTMKVIADLRTRLLPDAAEQEAKNMKTDGTRIIWDDDKDKPVDFPMNVREEDIIRNSLLDMDRDGSLTADHVSLYEKFVQRVQPPAKVIQYPTPADSEQGG